MIENVKEILVGRPAVVEQLTTIPEAQAAYIAFGLENPGSLSLVVSIIGGACYLLERSTQDKISKLDTDAVRPTVLEKDLIQAS